MLKEGYLPRRAEAYRHEKGHLVNMAGRGRYNQECHIENVIRYIWRERKEESRAGELLVKGAWGAPQWMGVKGVVQSFAAVQQLYSRKGVFGRYIDHEVYEFGDGELARIRRKGADMGEIARRMAENIYREGFQVAYAVHSKTGKENVHVHFAVNTVNYRDQRKRRETKAETRRREEAFQRIAGECQAGSRYKACARCF